MTSADPLVTIKHLRAEKLCARGGRELARDLGLDWQTFLEDGYPASVLEATGNHFAIQIARAAREEAP